MSPSSLTIVSFSGSIDANSALIIKGRFQQKQIESVLRSYISKRTNDLERENTNVSLFRGVRYLQDLPFSRYHSAERRTFDRSLLQHVPLTIFRHRHQDGLSSSSGQTCGNTCQSHLRKEHYLLLFCSLFSPLCCLGLDEYTFYLNKRMNMPEGESSLNRFLFGF